MQSPNDVMTFQLPATMTAETADALTQELIPLSLAQKTRFRLDTCAVENFSTVGAQVLVAFHKSIHAAGGELELTGENSAVKKILHEVGLGWLMNPLR